MTAIHLRKFGGIAPRHDPRVLAYDLAQVATNCRLESGILGAWRKSLLVGEPYIDGDVLSTYYHDLAHWLHWAKDVDVARSPIADNTRERIYFTGTDMPRVTDLDLAYTGSGDPPISSYAIGVPAPGAPVATLGGGGSGTARGLTYVLRFVNQWGEEGLASDASAVVTAMPGQTVTLTIPGATYDRPWVPITKVRIYRSLTGTSSTTFRYVDEVAEGTASYDDTKLDEEVAEAADLDFYPPPVDMVGIIAAPNNFMVGFRGNEILVSEVGQYHAYPVDYRKQLHDEIVAIAVAGQSIIVATKGRPYIIVGADPASLSEARLPYRQPCLSKRGMATGPMGSIYPSPHGLFMIDSGGRGELLTAGELTADTWKRFRPETMHATIYDGMYVAFYKTGEVGSEPVVTLATDGAMNQQKWNEIAMNEAAITEIVTPGETYSTGRGLIYDPSEAPGHRMTELDFYASSMFVDDSATALYLTTTTPSGSPQTLLFDSDPDGNRMPLSWKSKLFYARPTCLSHAQVYADFTYQIILNEPLGLGVWNAAGMNEVEFNGDILQNSSDTAPKPLTFRLYANGVLVGERSVTSDTPFRLPEGYQSDRFEIAVEGTPEVREIRVAETLEELQNNEYAA